MRVESVVEACSISRMTCRIFRVHQINERIVITINQNIFDLLSISRLFPFHPEFVTRDTPEPRITCLDCIFYCNSIGVRQHQNILSFNILHYHRYESIPLYKIQLIYEFIMNLDQQSILTQGQVYYNTEYKSSTPQDRIEISVLHVFQINLIFIDNEGEIRSNIW